MYLGGGTTAGTRFSQNGARAYPEHIQEVSRWEMIGDEYTSRMRYAINQAHSGDTVSDMLLHYDDWVGRFHPSVVSIMPEFEGEKSGLNVQARFEHDLSALISRAKSDGALVILQMPLTLRKDLSGCLATMRNLGQQEGVILLDLTRLAQETAQTMRAYRSDGLMKTAARTKRGACDRTLLLHDPPGCAEKQPNFDKTLFLCIIKIWIFLEEGCETYAG